MNPTQRNTTIALTAALVVTGTTLLLWPESSAPTFAISWRHPATNVSFNVYSATEPRLDAMTLRTNTTAKRAEFPAAKHQEFFAVRAVYPGNQLSPWATK